MKNDKFGIDNVDIFVHKAREIWHNPVVGWFVGLLFPDDARDPRARVGF